MTWLARTWAVCASSRCEAEILRTRALAAGWYARPQGGWLCPVHAPASGPVHDSARAGAGERDEP